MKTVQCIVGGAQSRSPNRLMGVGSVERLRLFSGDPTAKGSQKDSSVQQIRLITEVRVIYLRSLY